MTSLSGQPRWRANFLDALGYPLVDVAQQEIGHPYPPARPL
jgi:hypothetical protein